MSRAVTLVGAAIKLYLNNSPYEVAQGISFVVDYSETPIYGIDVIYPQEIATTRITVSGSVQGLRTISSGGLQAKNARPLFHHAMASPYVSIRIQDIASGEDILFIPQAKITQESHSAMTKSSYKLNFNFVGVIPYFALDRSK